MKNALYLLAILCFAVSFSSKAQTTYLAAYEQRAMIDFSNLKIDIAPRINFSVLDSAYSPSKDSVHLAMQDSLLNLIRNPEFVMQMLKEKIGEEVTMYAHLRADAVKAELEYSSGRSGINISSKKKFENGRWKNLNLKTKIYEPDTIQYTQNFVVTGASKQIVGYTCHEAQSKGDSSIIVWFSKEFPSTISPGIRITQINGAIFELTDNQKRLHIVLRSLQRRKD